MLNFIENDIDDFENRNFEAKQKRGLIKFTDCKTSDYFSSNVSVVRRFLNKRLSGQSIKKYIDT